MTMAFHEHTAVFGGSFNPPHLGHQIAIQGLLKNPGVSRVLVVPSWGTPLKQTSVSFQERLNLAKLAFSGIAEVSSIEEQHETRFTWQLLEILSAQTQNLAFVIGTDQFQSLRAWNRYPDVLKLSDWLVLIRKPCTLDSIADNIRSFASENIIIPTADPREWRINGSDRILRFVETDAQEISSTRIRENFYMNRAKENSKWLTPAVMEWIERNHLYGT